MNVYLHPRTLRNALTVRLIERRTGLMATATSKGNVKLIKPRAQLVRHPAPQSDWPPFGGDAA